MITIVLIDIHSCLQGLSNTLEPKIFAVNVFGLKQLNSCLSLVLYLSLPKLFRVADITKEAPYSRKIDAFNDLDQRVCL